MRLESSAAAALKEWRLSQTRRSSCCGCGQRKSFSYVLLWGWGGETYSCLIRRAHIADSRWGGDFFFIAEPLVQAQGRQEDLGRQPRFSSSQSQKKLCHSWEQLAWLLWQAEVAPKRAAKASFGSGNRRHIQTDFVVHRTPLKWKSSALSNHKQLAQLVYVK